MHNINAQSYEDNTYTKDNTNIGCAVVSSVGANAIVVGAYIFGKGCINKYSKNNDTNITGEYQRSAGITIIEVGSLTIIGSMIFYNIEKLKNTHHVKKIKYGVFIDKHTIEMMFSYRF